MTTIPSKQPSTKTINVRVPVDLYRKLENLARATDRTKSFVTVEALTTYLDAQAWMVQDIEAGVADADRGDFATAAEVNAAFRRHGA